MYLVELMYFAFTRMPGKIYRKWLRSLLCLYDVFRPLINSLVCKILDCLHATQFQNINASGWPKLSLTLLGINYISRTNYLSRNMFRLFSLINRKVYQADPGAPSPWQKKRAWFSTKDSFKQITNWASSPWEERLHGFQQTTRLSK